MTMVLKFGTTFISGDKLAMKLLHARYPGMKPANSANLVSSVARGKSAIIGMRHTLIDGLRVKIATILPTEQPHGRT